ncbi:ABC transporter permease [uncultured Alistipes sp.]|uniref:ABC transporter permease n=1 Tax=uncultured Alistipes sp. TaxID=538949 RepID=UPI002634772C|nr:ABC transporter permease [uncultured Alistipes sp.]
MKQFFSFVGKEFRHIFRDRRTMLILLAMPVVLIILFGFAITTEVNHVRLAVYAPSNDELTRRITERFSANDYFDIVETVRDPKQIDALFRRNRIDAVLLFGHDFQNDLMHTGQGTARLIVDGSEPNSASMMTTYAENILAGYRAELAAENATSLSPTILPQVKLLYNPQMKSAYSFVPGVMGLILILICAMMTSISIVREKERGSMEVLLVSPVRPIAIILAKVVPYFCISTVNLISILLLTVYVLKVPIEGSLFWLSLLSLVYIFVALAMGLLISSLVATQVTAMIASGLLLMLPVMVLSGMIFPIENMPGILQALSTIVPARWYVAGIKKIMIEGLPVSYVLKELGILSLMALLLITASLKTFKNRLE